MADVTMSLPEPVICGQYERTLWKLAEALPERLQPHQGGSLRGNFDDRGNAPCLR